MSLPGWLQGVLSYARYVVPVAIAFVLARGEVRRHRSQDGRTSREVAGRPTAEGGHRARPDHGDPDGDRPHGEPGAGG